MFHVSNKGLSPEDGAAEGGDLPCTPQTLLGSVPDQLLPLGASEKLGKVFSIHMCVYIYICRRGYFQALDIVNTLKAEMQFLSPRAELGVCQCFRVNLPGPGCVTALCLLKVPEEDTER